MSKMTRVREEEVRKRKRKIVKKPKGWRRETANVGVCERVANTMMERVRMRGRKCEREVRKHLLLILVTGVLRRHSPLGSVRRGN